MTVESQLSPIGNLTRLSTPEKRRKVGGQPVAGTRPRTMTGSQRTGRGSALQESEPAMQWGQANAPGFAAFADKLDTRARRARTEVTCRRKRGRGHNAPTVAQVGTGGTHAVTKLSCFM